MTDLPEESFQVLRQLRPAGVTRVHGDEDSHAMLELDVLPEEVEDRLLVANGVLDTFDLHGHHGQDLYGDSVELVKTAPGSRLRQALVDVADRLERKRIHKKRPLIG